MKQFLLSLILGLTLSSAAARAEETMKISDAYSFATAGAVKTGAAFMTLTYPAGEGIVPDRIIRVETPVSAKAELHTMSVEDNVMTMRPVDSLPLPPTGSFMLKPQGVHVMLMDLKQPLKKGDSFPLTLVFARSGAVTTTVAVRAPGDIPAADKAMPPMKMAPGMPMDHSQHGL